MTQVGQDDEIIGEDEDRPSGRALRPVLPIILLVLLLLLSCSLATFASYQVTAVRFGFLVKNAQCLKCHTEVLDDVTKASMHQPYAAHQCTSCHLQHSRLATATSRTTKGTVTTETWLRWGPARFVIKTVEGVFGTKDIAVTTKRRSAIGVSSLIVPADQLCWTCHGNLRGQREGKYLHQPFASSHCLSCHEPHASDSKPLLTQTPENLCLTCHPLGLELGRKQAHQPVAKHRCLECHNAHGSDYAGILIARQRDLCFTCHPSVAMLSNEKTQHAPFEGDDCTGCHEPHGSDYTPLLVDESPRLCYNCHKSLESRFARTSHHPVGTKVECESCHQPHASPQASLLLEPEQDLCTGCHIDQGAMSTMAVQHKPFSDGPCTACHVPHGSQFKPLLNNPQPNLCYQCHPSLYKAMTRESHHPTECTMCHEVHAGDNPSLLPAPVNNQLCYRCHGYIEPSFVDSKHKPMECLQCHRHHGSRYGNLLRTSAPEVCTQCHKNTSSMKFEGNGDEGHRATPRFYDVHSKSPLTCSSSCHNPHGTVHRYMVRDYPANLDGVCLRCHPTVGKLY